MVRIEAGAEGRVEEHSAHNIASAIKEAVKFLPKNFVPRHEHSKRCYRVLRHILHPDEYTVIEAKQSLLRSITPKRLVATNQRIIVVKPSFWSLWAGRNLFSPTKYESIPYGNVINIALFTGAMFSTLCIHLNTNANNGEDDVEGLKTGDAEAMFAFLEKMADIMREQGRGITAMEDVPSSHDSTSHTDQETKSKFVGYRGIRANTAGH